MSNASLPTIRTKRGSPVKRRLLIHIVAYVAAASAWIAGTDFIVHHLALPPRWTEAAETAKGIGFVLLTALAYYLLALRAERREAHSADRLSQVLGGSVDGIWFVDRHGTTTWANEVMGRILGVDAADMVGRPYSEFVPLKHVALISARLLGTAATPGDVAEISLLRSDGRPVRVIASAQPLADQEGQVVGAFSIITDITDAVRVRSELSQREQAIDQLPVAFCLADATRPDHPLVYVNRSFTVLTGYSAEDCHGRNCRFLQGDDTDQPAARAIARALADRIPGTAVLRNYRKDGTLFLNELTVVPLCDEDGTVSHFAGIQLDITERMRNAEKLEQLAFTDALTQFPNRASFEAALTTSPPRPGWAVAIIDVERLRDVNATRGRHVGNTVLRQIGQRLAVNLAEDELVARIGGDQFALFHRTDSETAAPAAIDAVMAALSEPYDIGHDHLVLSFTIGAAIVGADTSGPLDALQKAEVALYAAKADRSRRPRIYDRNLGQRTLDGISITEQLRTALDHRQFELFYQPKVSLVDGGLVGAEALIRWNHPTRGLQSPDSFIPAAEKSGLIIPIGGWALHEAARQIRCWRESGLVSPRIAVNISRLQFDGGGVNEAVAEALSANGLPPSALALELTESLLMDVSAAFIDQLTALRDLGCTLAIDDFGTGFSSLAYLHRFPLAELKIDRSFVKGLPHDPHSRSIVGVIVGLAHALSLTVTAEGVEHANQAEYLAAIGCDAAQGYYFFRPMPAERFAACLSTGLAVT